MSDPRIEDAVRREDPGALLRIAAKEATRRDRSGIYGVLSRLGAVAKVAFLDQAQTARIGLRGGEIRLEFGPTFVRENLKTPADLHGLLPRITIGHRTMLALCALGPATTVDSAVEDTAWREARA